MVSFDQTMVTSKLYGELQVKDFFTQNKQIKGDDAYID